MRLAVRANDIQKDEWLSRQVPVAAEVEWISPGVSLANKKADAVFDLVFDEAMAKPQDYAADQLLFINSVGVTLTVFKRPQTVRINGWNGFLAHETLEIHAGEPVFKRAAEILEMMGWKPLQVPDEPGFVSPRVIAMIINEAYFGLQDKISTKKDIDTAMKLGTNYPYGPFEWAEKIGLNNVYRLLKRLQENNDRYTVAALLEQEAGG